MIDLRSDTVSQPTKEMRRIMSEAELGDDVIGDDPNVRALEERAAILLNKEATIIMPSGTQANLAAILSHCQRGDEIILGSESHIFHYELAGTAAIAGVQVRLVPNDSNGYFDIEQLATSFRPSGLLFPPTTLVCMENTQGRCSGAPIDELHMSVVGNIAHEQGVAFHLDGARLFNAAVALNVSVANLAEPADSVAFSLSKGLGVPIGSMLCGSKTFITRARRLRKMLGGTMNKVGMIAAAGLYALDHMVERLAEDHRNASLLRRLRQRVSGFVPSVTFPSICHIHERRYITELSQALWKRVVGEIREAGRNRLACVLISRKSQFKLIG